MKKVIKMMLAFAAVFLCGGAWADYVVTPKMLVNFRNSREAATQSGYTSVHTEAVDGWTDETRDGEAAIPTGSGATLTVNGISFATTGGSGRLWANSWVKPNSEYADGSYLDINDKSHTSLIEEIKASIGLPDLLLTEDVYKTGFLNGGGNNQTGTISGLRGDKKYLVYIGFGLRKGDSPNDAGQAHSFKLESTGYGTAVSLQYVKVGASGDAISYSDYSVGTTLKASLNGMMLVRMLGITPNASGNIAFTMPEGRSGFNFLIVAEVEEEQSEPTRVISMNFDSRSDNTAALVDTTSEDQVGLVTGVPGKAWNNQKSRFRNEVEETMTDVNMWSGSEVVNSNVSISYKANNCYQNMGREDVLIKGYLDDGGNRANITVNNIPFKMYSVIVYCGTDTGTYFSPVKINGIPYRWGNDGIEVADSADATTTTRWGTGNTATAQMGVNVLKLENITGSTLTIVGGNNKNSARGGIAAFQIVEQIVEDSEVDCEDNYAISSANALSAQVVTLNVIGGNTLVVDEVVNKNLIVKSEGDVVITSSNYTITDADFEKIDFSGIGGKVVFASDCVFIPRKTPTGGIVYRFEKDYSTGFTFPAGATGIYEFKNAKISNNPGAGVTVRVQQGDRVVSPTGGQSGQRGDVSFMVLDGALQIGSDSGTASIWYGVSNVKYEQTGGTVNVTANGTGDGNGNGFLLGWSGALSQFEFTGGVFNLPNSRLNFWSAPINMNVSGTATVKIKGLFAGSGTTHTATLAGNGVIELGSLGWANVPLTLNGGTLKATDSSIFSAAIVASGAANIEVDAAKELKLTGSVTGSGVITKRGEGVLNVGSARPTINVVSGSVKIVASTEEIAAGCLVLPIPENAEAGSSDKVSIVTAEGNPIEINGDPIIDVVNHTITIRLVTIPTITEATTISSLNLSEDKTGTLIIQGAETEEAAYTVTFDVALPAGVDVTVNGHIILAGANVPNNKINIETGTNLTIPTFTGTVASGITITTASATGTIVNNGTLNVTGDSSYTLTNTGTLNIDGGVSTITSSGQSVMGTVNIAHGATYKCTNNDQVPHSGSTTTTINVRGTLNMQNHRWTLGGADTLNLYGGCTVSGQGDNDGIFDLYRSGDIINVKPGEGDQASETIVTIPAPIRARNTNGNINIAQGMKLALTGGIKDADTANSVINMNGNGRLTGTILLKGGFTLNLGNSVGTIDAKFVAENGTTVLKLGESADSTQITTSDSKDDPIVLIKSGATLDLYVKDFSSWNQAVTQYGWIKNEGTLNIYEYANTQSRYFRGHLVMQPGTTTTLYGTSQNFIVYGGNSDVAKAQMIVPASDTAATATFAGEGTIQLNVDGSGGTADSAWDVGANSTLNVTAKVIGGEVLAKYGSGTLAFSNSENTYSGTITLHAGAIKSKKTFGEGKVIPGDANKKVVVSDVDADGYTSYSLAQRDPTDVYLKYENSAYKYVLSNNSEVTLIDGDVIVVDSTHYGSDAVWHLGEYKVFPSEFADHTLKINSNSNLKRSIPANQTVVIGANVYLHANVGAGAQISGTGVLYVGYPSDCSTINNNVDIDCSVAIGEDNPSQGIYVHGVIINGRVTMTKTVTISHPTVGFKLADDAIFNVKTQLANGKVTTDVVGKVVKKVVNDDTTITYSLVDASPDAPITPGEGEIVIPVVPDAGIAIEPGANVKVPTGTDASEVEVVYNGVELSKAVEGESGHPKYVEVSINRTTGAIELTTTDSAKPATTAIAMAAPTEEGADKVQFTITNPIPGLFYAVSSCDEPNGEFATGSGDQATSGDVKTVSIPMTFTGGKKVKYYKVSVKATR